MQHEQLINDLLDGELDSTGEATLFGQLANDSELRSEFMQQLMIRNAVQSDRATLVPPIPLTSAVFAGLGFAAPLAGAAAGASAVTHTGGFLSSWLARIGIPFMAALASAGITFAVMSGDDPSMASGQGGSSTMTPQSAATEPRVVERIVERVVERPSPTDARLVRENEDLRQQLAEVSRQAEQRLLTDENPPVPVTVSQTSLQPTSIEILRDGSEHVLMAEQLTPIQMPTHVPSFSLMVRGVNAQSPGLAVLPQTSWRDNIGLSMLYRLSSTDAVGIEIGSESFPMVFSGLRNQQQVQFEMQPLVTWAGLSYRHVFSEIGTSRFSPFAQAIVGGTEFGPIGRASAGIMYSPAGPLSFMFGVEGSALGFTHQNQWFTSTKYGFTYGVAVRL
ncbi:MAG: hypothetical protein FGM33_06430 [Candidatus Kapabacteria bacterium]|nr:hypothetical protein [Candidatus Kapabacteria bacterium]